MDNSSKCQASLVPQGFLLLCFQIPVIQPQLHPCSSPLHLPYPTDVVVDSAQGHSHSSLTDYTEASSNTEWSCVRPVKSAPPFRQNILSSPTHHPKVSPVPPHLCPSSHLPQPPSGHDPISHLPLSSLTSSTHPSLPTTPTLGLSSGDTREDTTSLPGSPPHVPSPLTTSCLLLTATFVQPPSSSL